MMIEAVLDRNQVGNPSYICTNMYVVFCFALQLGILISEKLKHPSTWLFLLTLWLLSTWFGTFILCGMASLSMKFPFFHSYPDLSPEKRQKILKSWSLSYFRLLRMFFRTIKLLTLLSFFTQVRVLCFNF